MGVFFTSGPNSPFAAFAQADGGGTILGGETLVTIVPEPATGVALALALGGLAGLRSAASIWWRG